jgi:uncharacterized Rmd1/YagE family protein
MYFLAPQFKLLYVKMERVGDFTSRSSMLKKRLLYVIHMPCILTETFHSAILVLLFSFLITCWTKRSCNVLEYHCSCFLLL